MRALLKVIVVTVILVAICAIAVVLSDRKMPDDWRKIHIGMSRGDVQLLQCDILDNEWDQGHVDILIKKCRFQLNERWWVCQVEYTKSKTVKKAQVAFIDPGYQLEYPPWRPLTPDEEVASGK